MTRTTDIFRPTNIIPLDFDMHELIGEENITLVTEIYHPNEVRTNELELINLAFETSFTLDEDFYRRVAYQELDRIVYKKNGKKIHGREFDEAIAEIEHEDLLGEKMRFGFIEQDRDCILNIVKDQSEEGREVYTYVEVIHQNEEEQKSFEPPNWFGEYVTAITT
jgi:hypothetical protein